MLTYFHLATGQFLSGAIGRVLCSRPLSTDLDFRLLYIMLAFFEQFSEAKGLSI